MVEDGERKMFPLRDENPSYQFPLVVITLIVVNAVIFILEAAAPNMEQIFYIYGTIPAVVTGKQVVAGNLGVWTLFTSMFLHGNLWHLVGNMYFLWLFGDNIEWVMGHFRFLLFYLLCGLLAGGVQVAFSPSSTLPAVGASGAIAGVMGLYLVTYPSARILTLVTTFYFWRVVAFPAVLWLGFWFLLQIFGGVMLFGLPEAGSIAYWAHIGGFVSGIVLGIPLRYRERIIHLGYDGVPSARRRRPSFLLEDTVEHQRVTKGFSSAPVYGAPELDRLIRQRDYDSARALAEKMLDEAIRQRNARMIQVYQNYLDYLRMI